MIENYNKNTPILQERSFPTHKLMTNDIIIKLQDNGFTKEAEQVKDCGSYLVFSHQEHQLTQEYRNKLKKANFCKFRFCPMCNWRRTRNISGQLLEALESIEATRSVDYLFLTLTVENPKIIDLKATIEHLNKSFKRMSETKAYENAVIGHLKALELLGDETKNGEAHPHFHILLIVSKSYFKSKNYLSQAKWVDMWQKALKVDYKPIVQIQKIKQKKNTTLTNLQSAVLETAKYSVKHTELTNRTNKDFSIIINQTKNMKFFNTGGLLKKKMNLIKADEDLINFKAEQEAFWKELEELIYHWENGNYYLKKEK